MNLLPLTESFDSVGEWFLPEAPDRKITGSLSYKDRRIELHLNGVFQALGGSVHVGDLAQAYPLVHGVARDGSPITLMEGRRIGGSFGSAPSSETLFATLLVAGAHVSCDDLYTQLRCRVPGLHIWLSQKVVDHCLPTVGEETQSIAAKYRILMPPEVITRIQNVEANIGWGIEVTRNVDPFKLAVSSAGWLRLCPDRPQPLDWFFKQLQKLTTLLTFLFGSSAVPDCLSLSLGNPNQEGALLTNICDFKTCTYSNFHEFYMLRSAMGKTLEDVIQRWFEVYDNIMAPSQLAISVLVSENLWQHIEFLSLIQALEGFHRSQLMGLYVQPQDYDAVVSALVNAIPSNISNPLKDSLCSRLRFANEKSLRNRLKELAYRLSSPIRQLIFGGNDKVPEEWIDTRNYYTHWDEKLRQNVLDGQGMVDANVRIRHFLRALYLDLAGIPQEAILRALNSHSDGSQHLLQINAMDRQRTDSSLGRDPQ
jgi:hypothetical protein